VSDHVGRQYHGNQGQCKQTCISRSGRQDQAIPGYAGRQHEETSQIGWTMPGVLVRKKEWLSVSSIGSQVEPGETWQQQDMLIHTE
jgi:hypothetical protein